ncbi:MAG: hypothetical protein JWS10_631 [Cypionkella sp.]|nr:hypothetical protein [Cypionkella sp.]
MSLYVNLSEIRDATKLGVLAVRSLVRHPYPLPFALAPACKKGGNQVRLYLWSDVAPRLRQTAKITENVINALLLIAQSHHENKGLQP